MEGDSRWLRGRGAGARKPLAAAIALGELSGILLILQTAFLVAVGNGAIMEHRSLGELCPYFVGLLATIMLRFLASWASRRSAFVCAAIVKREVRHELIGGLRRIGSIALVRMRAGQIAEVVFGAVESLEGYYSGYLPQRAIATLLPFTVLAVVFPLDWISGLILALTAVFLPISMIAIGEEAHERNQRLWATLARMSGRFLDSLRGLATVKIFGAVRREIEEIGRSTDEYRLATMSVLRIAFLSSFMLEFITSVSIAIVAVITGLRLLSGTMHFSSGYFILLIAPEYFLTLRTLGAQYHARMGAASAATQVRELMEQMGSEHGSRYTPANTSDADIPIKAEENILGSPSTPGKVGFERPASFLKTLLGPWGTGRERRQDREELDVPVGTDELVGTVLNQAADRIGGVGTVGVGTVLNRLSMGAAVEVEGLSFAYGERPVLESLSFSLKPGERLALLGPSGCGKSTVLALFLGLLIPRAGRILLDGRDLASLGRSELYQELAWLPQRPALFHGTILSNVALGRPAVSERDIEAAIRAAHVDEFAYALPQGLDTLVGDGGCGLSVGQVQRVALARLFLRSPRLILLDEPTAHLDSESEALVNDSIVALAEGRTMILATHRPTVPADRELTLSQLFPISDTLDEGDGS